MSLPPTDARGRAPVREYHDDPYAGPTEAYESYFAYGTISLNARQRLDGQDPAPYQLPVWETSPAPARICT